jgi:hypothetical protein
MSFTRKFRSSKNVYLLRLLTLVPEMYTDIGQLLYNKMMNQPTVICRHKVQKYSYFLLSCLFDKDDSGFPYLRSCNGLPLQTLRATYRPGTTFK